MRKTSLTITPAAASPAPSPPPAVHGESKRQLSREKDEPTSPSAEPADDVNFAGRPSLQHIETVGGERAVGSDYVDMRAFSAKKGTGTTDELEGSVPRVPVDGPSRQYGLPMIENIFKVTQGKGSRPRRINLMNQGKTVTFKQDKSGGGGHSRNHGKGDYTFDQISKNSAYGDLSEEKSDGAGGNNYSDTRQSLTVAGQRVRRDARMKPKQYHHQHVDHNTGRFYSSLGGAEVPSATGSVSREIRSRQLLPNLGITQGTQTSKMHNSIEIDEATFTKAQNKNMNILSQIDNYEVPVRVVSQTPLHLKRKNKNKSKNSSQASGAKMMGQTTYAQSAMSHLPSGRKQDTVTVSNQVRDRQHFFQRSLMNSRQNLKELEMFKGRRARNFAGMTTTGFGRSVHHDTQNSSLEVQKINLGLKINTRSHQKNSLFDKSSQFAADTNSQRSNKNMASIEQKPIIALKSSIASVAASTTTKTGSKKLGSAAAGMARKRNMHMTNRFDRVTRGTSQGTQLNDEVQGNTAPGRHEDEMVITSIMAPSDRSSLQGCDFGRHRLIDGFHYPVDSMMYSSKQSTGFQTKLMTGEPSPKRGDHQNKQRPKIVPRIRLTAALESGLLDSKPRNQESLRGRGHHQDSLCSSRISMQEINQLASQDIKLKIAPEASFGDLNSNRFNRDSLVMPSKDKPRAHYGSTKSYKKAPQQSDRTTDRSHLLASTHAPSRREVFDMAIDLLQKKGLDPKGNMVASLHEKFVRETSEGFQDSFIEPSIISNQRSNNFLELSCPSIQPNQSRNAFSKKTTVSMVEKASSMTKKRVYLGELQQDQFKITSRSKLVDKPSFNQSLERQLHNKSSTQDIDHTDLQIGKQRTSKNSNKMMNIDVRRSSDMKKGELVGAAAASQKRRSSVEYTPSQSQLGSRLISPNMSAVNLTATTSKKNSQMNRTGQVRFDRAAGKIKEDMQFEIALKYNEALRHQAKLSISNVMGRFGRNEYRESLKSLRNPSSPGEALKIEQLTPFEARWITIPLRPPVEEDKAGSSKKCPVQSSMPSPLVLLIVVEPAAGKDWDTNIQIFASSSHEYPNKNEHEWSFNVGKEDSQRVSKSSECSLKACCVTLKAPNQDNLFKAGGQVRIGFFVGQNIATINYIYTFKVNQSMAQVQNFYPRLAQIQQTLCKSLGFDNQKETRFDHFKRKQEILRTQHTKVKFEERLDVEKQVHSIVEQQASLQRPDHPLLRKRIIDEIKRVQELDAYEQRSYIKQLISSTWQMYQQVHRSNSPRKRSQDRDSDDQGYRSMSPELTAARHAMVAEKRAERNLEEHKRNVFLSIRRQLLSQIRQESLEQMRQHLQERARIIKWISIIQHCKMMRNQLANFLYRKNAFIRAVRVMICAKRLLRYFRSNRVRFAPTLQERNRTMIKHVMINFSTNKIVSRIAMDRSKFILRAFLKDRNTRIHQWTVRVRRMQDQIKGMQSRWRAISTMYHDKVEALINGSLKQVDQLRAEIVKTKSLAKKYQWFLDEINVCVLKSNPALREICQQYVERQKLERAINMIRWFALYSQKGTGYVDKEAFLKYKRFIEVHVAEDAKRYPDAMFKQYMNVLKAVDEHRIARLRKEEAKELQAALAQQFSKKQNPSRKISLKSVKQEDANKKKRKQQQKASAAFGMVKRLVDKTKSSMSTSKDQTASNDNLQDESEGNRPPPDENSMSEQLACTLLESIGLKPWKLDPLIAPVFETDVFPEDEHVICVQTLLHRRQHLKGAALTAKDEVGTRSAQDRLTTDPGGEEPAQLTQQTDGRLQEVEDGKDQE